MKTSKILFIIATLLYSTGLTACGDNFSSSFKDFKDLCEASGGDVVEGKDNVCKCDKECATGVVCIEGKCADSVEKKCDVNQEEYCENGNLYRCSNDGILVMSPCAKGCLNEKECRECADGETKCEDDGIKKCVNGKWGESDKSCKGFGCFDNNNCKKCDENKGNVCEGDKYRMCVGGMLSPEVNCPDQNSCKDDSNCGECNNDSKKCGKNGVRQVCQSGTWVDSPCDNGQVCSAGNCISGKCDVNKTYQVCNNDGDKKGTVEKCENGQVDVINCENSCNGNDCGGCLNDDTKCENNGMRTCSGGKWSETPEQCLNNLGCHENGKECKECNSEDTKCGFNEEMNAEYTCTDNKWMVDKYCLNGVSCKSDKCGKCKNGTTQCDGKNVQICNNGDWKNDKSCSNGCDNGECVGETNQCTNNGDHQCDGNVYQVCHGGSWEKEHTCSAAETCDEDKGCMCLVNNLQGNSGRNDFVPASTICKLQDGNAQATCNNDGTWDDNGACAGKNCKFMDDGSQNLVCCGEGTPCGGVCCSGKCDVDNKCKCKDGDEEYVAGTGYCTLDDERYDVKKICGSDGDWETATCAPWETCVDQAVECKTLCEEGDEYICRNGKIYKCSGSGSDGAEVTDENITGKLVSGGACVTSKTVCLNGINYKKSTEQSNANEPIIWINTNEPCGVANSCSDNNKGEVCKDVASAGKPYKYCNGSGYKDYKNSNSCVNINNNVVEVNTECSSCNPGSIGLGTDPSPACMVYNYYKDKDDKTINQCPSLSSEDASR